MTAIQAERNASPLQAYRQHLDAGELEADAAQAEVVEQLDTLYHRLLQPEPRPGLFKRLTGRVDPVRLAGLYIWGSVGRGKT